MSDEKKRKEVEKKAQTKKVQNLERALREERLALTALAMAFVKSHGNVDLLMSNVEAMVQAAADNPRTKPKVRQTLIDGHRILERALAVHRGRPQPLFDDELRPNTGHVNPSDAKALANPPEAVQQGLPLNGGGVAEAVAAHEERQRTRERIEEAMIRVIREHDPMTDVELYDVYCADEAAPKVPWETFYDVRTDLTRRGRIIDNGERKFVKSRMRPVWDVLERSALT